MQRWLGLAIALAACSGSGTAASTDGASTPVADAPGGVGEPAELAGITLYHNQVRMMVDTTGLAAGPLPALEWDASLAATAAAWVAQCQDTSGDGLVDHNANRSAGHPWYVGENIFASTGTATAHDAVLYPMYGWAAEQAHYHYDTNTCDAGATCGHYTQLVWRATQKLGCALGRCPGLAFPSTIVCDYGPGGNVNNEKPY
jgi:cysteine-rich secretory family protein